MLEPVEGFEFIDKVEEEAQFYLRPQEKATRTFVLQGGFAKVSGNWPEMTKMSCFDPKITSNGSF